MPESRVDAAASVLPAPSSTSWAKMCRADRLMASRGLSAVPVIFLRTRRCRRARRDVRAAVCLPALALVAAMSLLPSLPDLAADVFAGVPQALPLVRVGLAELAYVGGDFAHLLLVDPLDNQPGGGFDAQRDPFRRADGDRVAEAQGELEVGAPRLDPVADTDDFQRLAVALGHPGHHVRDQRPGQAVQRPHVALVVGPGHGDFAAVDGDVDAAGDRHGHASDT